MEGYDRTPFTTLQLQSFNRHVTERLEQEKETVSQVLVRNARFYFLKKQNVTYSCFFFFLSQAGCSFYLDFSLIKISLIKYRSRTDLFQPQIFKPNVNIRDLKCTSLIYQNVRNWVCLSWSCSVTMWMGNDVCIFASSYNLTEAWSGSSNLVPGCVFFKN